jgi:hypothetical protein
MRYFDNNYKELNKSTKIKTSYGSSKIIKKIVFGTITTYVVKTTLTYVLSTTIAVPLISTIGFSSSIIKGSSIADGVVSAFNI